jgi:glycosyltransferase involved in cell wall biosynthesis
MLGFEENYPIIGCYGFVNINKRLEVVIEVFKDIASLYPKAKLLIAGDMEAGYKRSLTDLVKKYGIYGNVAMTGYADEEAYKRYIACADIVVNLRYPTMGETSATLLDAMALGKPVVVSNIGSYIEYPDRCCWKVDVDADEKELLEAYLVELSENKELREIMGRKAREYIFKNHRWEKVAMEYIKMIRDLKSDDG